MTDSTAQPRGNTALAERVEAAAQTQRPWRCIVWDDPVNTMSYVTYVFASYFGYSRARAERLMLQVHRNGRAVVASGARETIETAVTAMHAYGLWATAEVDHD